MKKFFDAFEKGLTGICLVLLVSYAILVAVQVITRYFFNSPLVWTEICARYLFVWSVMLYMPVLYRKHGNPRFDLLAHKQKQSVQALLWILSDALAIFTGLALLVFGTKYCALSQRKMIEGLVGVQIPMNVVYSSIPSGGACLMLMACEQFGNNIRFSSALRKEGK